MRTVDLQRHSFTKKGDDRGRGSHLSGEGVRAARRVLVVGHGGWLESVVARLVAPDVATTLGGSFWHLDGIRMAVSPTSVTVEAFARQPR